MADTAELPAVPRTDPATHLHFASTRRPPSRPEPRSGRFVRTGRASNLSPAAPLEAQEEEKQGMAAGELTVTDAALIARAQAGDHAAFEVIFNQYQTQIYNYIYRLMGSAEDAYDLTQDTFLKAYLALPKTSDDLRVGAWLYRIATNVCLDELRHRKLVKWQPWEAFISVFHPSQVAKDSPERDCIDRENTEEVQLILNRLQPKYRMCLILREYHDLSYDEIAEVLNTTRAAVKSLLFRAREEFRQVYARMDRKPGRPTT
jgi:RNA polymerase sigma-70 factor (ECF subfamily)